MRLSDSTLLARSVANTLWRVVVLYTRLDITSALRSAGHCIPLAANVAERLHKQIIRVKLIIEEWKT